MRKEKIKAGIPMVILASGFLLTYCLLSGCSESSESVRQQIPVALSAQQYEQAASRAEQVLTESPDDHETRLWLAEAHLGLTHLDKAAEQLKLLLEQRPDWRQARRRQSPPANSPPAPRATRRRPGFPPRGSLSRRRGPQSQCRGRDAVRP